MNTTSRWAYWKTVVVSTAVGRGIIQIDRSAFLPMLPAMAGVLGLSGTQAGSIASAYSLFYVGLMVPAGALGDSFGLKRLVVVSYFLTAIGLLAAGLVARSYPTILLALAIHGLGAGAYFPSAYAMLLREVPAVRRGLSMGVVFTGTSLGTGLGFVIAGIAYAITGEWWAGLAALTVPTILAALSCVVMLREGPAAPKTLGLGSLKPILGHKDLMLLTASYFCYLCGFSVALTWGAGFLATDRGFSLSWAAALTSIIAFTSLPLAAVWGRLSDRWGRKRLYICLVFVGALAIAGMATFRSPIALVFFLVVYGAVGPLAMGPVSVAWCLDFVTTSRLAPATAVGVFNAIGMSSAFFAPVAGGWLWDVTGSFEPAFYAAAAVVLLSSVLALLPRETVPAKRTAVEPAKA